MWGHTRPSWVEVDLLQFARNLEAIESHVGGAEMMPVVKADAYGHGDVLCSRVAMDLGYRRLAVAILDEALHLREAGITASILVLGYTPPSQVAAAVEHDIALTVFDGATLEACEGEAADQGRRVRVHLKVETGMNRIGVSPGPGLDRLLGKLWSLKHVVLEGVFTHFAAADEDRAFTQAQMERFAGAVEMVENAGYADVLKHAANSAGVLDFPGAHLDVVRPGLIMYGYYPSASVSRSVAVKPPLRWYARIVQVKELKPGDTVGYNRTYRVKKPLQVASLPVGYADGYPRILSNRGSVLLHGQRAPVIGRVCMDQMMIDVTGIPQARPGALCTLLGPGHDAEDMSQLAHTIPHEILTGISPRVPRLYGGQ